MEKVLKVSGGPEPALSVTLSCVRIVLMVFCPEPASKVTVAGVWLLKALMVMESARPRDAVSASIRHTRWNLLMLDLQTVLSKLSALLGPELELRLHKLRWQRWAVNMKRPHMATSSPAVTN
jgi:hypothetical protein